ncbi:MAG: twin-arginine translocase TatA/TatE family subunit [Anaerolineae bacterium]|nr:twin-arginine translocase TatA/TatE family subunit [Anaerolineae bacterium]
MDVLKNFNWIELLFILVLGVILFGPDRLPAIGAKLGSYARALQGLSTQFMAQWWKEAGVAEAAHEGTDVVTTVREVVAEVRSAVRPIEEAAAAAVVLETPPPAPAVSDTGHEPATQASEEAEPGPQKQALVGRVAELEKQMRELQATLARLETERVATLSG